MTCSATPSPYPRSSASRWLPSFSPALRAPATRTGTGPGSPSSIGGPLDSVDVKATPPGSFVTVLLSSPAQTFVGRPVILLAELFNTGMPPNPVFPGIVVSGQLSTFVVIGSAGSPLGTSLLPAGGTGVSFIASPFLSGQSALFQGLVPDSFANNGIFASTNGHEFAIQ